MLKKTVTYIDPFTKQEETRVMYFNLTKAELLELEYEMPGTMSARLREMGEEGAPGALIMDTVRRILQKSYVERLPDGSIDKGPVIFARFAATEAYSTFFMELVTDSKAAAAFGNAIMPPDLVEQAKAEQAAMMDDPDKPTDPPTRRGLRSVD